MLPAFEAALTFAGPAAAAAMRACSTISKKAVHGGSRSSRRPSSGWTLPLYELALLTARHAPTGASRPELALVTPEPRPLALFGDRASTAVAELLAAAGIEFIGASHVEPVEDGVRLLPSGRTPPPRGWSRCRSCEVRSSTACRRSPTSGSSQSTATVASTGSTACTRQATLRTSRSSRAAWPRSRPTPSPSTLPPATARGSSRRRSAGSARMLFAGGPDRYLRAGDDAVAAQPLWWPPTKIAGRYLAPYVTNGSPRRPRTGARGSSTSRSRWRPPTRHWWRHDPPESTAR